MELLYCFLTDFYTNDLWECAKFGILIESQEKTLILLKSITVNDENQKFGMLAKIHDETTQNVMYYQELIGFHMVLIYFYTLQINSIGKKPI